MPKPLSELVAPDWAEALAPVEADVAKMGEFLRSELAQGRGYLPEGKNVLRAFSRPLSDVRVLIVGQDPYPTPGHAVGLSFSVNRDVRPIPRSLINIYQGSRMTWASLRRSTVISAPGSSRGCCCSTGC